MTTGQFAPVVGVAGRDGVPVATDNATGLAVSSQPPCQGGRLAVAA